MSENISDTYRPGPRLLDNYTSAGKVLQFWRKMNNVKTDELAMRAELKRDLDSTAPELTLGFIVRYERGRLAPHKDHLEAIGWVLDARDAILDAFGYEVSSEPVDPISTLEAASSMMYGFIQHH